MKETTRNRIGRGRNIAYATLLAGAFTGPWIYALGLVHGLWPDRIAEHMRERANMTSEEREAEKWKPRVHVYDDRTEVDFRPNDRWYGGYVFIDDGSDGTVDRKKLYPLPFRGVGGVKRHEKITDKDQARYDEVMSRE
ncbi:MAG: hypothetical protein Q8P81_01940 [Nanoarchaeota archaeon]|nr:hypothetical protein [Nanoarchaeota archaeon]